MSSAVPETKDYIENLIQWVLPQQSVQSKKAERARHLIFYIIAAVLVLVPLVFSRNLFWGLTIPKFVLLLIASSVIGALLFCFGLYERRLLFLRSPFCLLVVGYLAALAVSSAFSINPIISFQGSFGRCMGFITHLCFGVCFFGVIVGVNDDRRKFDRLLWAIVSAGLLVSVYGLGQVTGIFSISKPILNSLALESVERANMTFDHADFAGNFLLYIVFVALGIGAAASSGRLKAAAFFTAAAAAASAVFTGTRGAWLGLIFGGAVLLVLISIERNAVIKGLSKRMQLIIGAALLAATLAGVAIVGFTDLGGPVRSRLLAFSAEGFTGAGRKQLWGMTLRMLPRYWATGCGLEMFKVAALPYDTFELARLSGGSYSDDPHNAYLSSLINTGVFASLLYFALTALAVLYLYRSIRREEKSGEKWIGIGLLSSFAAVLAHNFFVFNIVPTGLYFFAFLAVAYLRYQFTIDEKAQSSNIKIKKSLVQKTSRDSGRIREILIWSACSIPFLASLVYSYDLVSAHRNALNCTNSAALGDYDKTIQYGEQAARTPIYQTDYNFYYARALEKLYGNERSKTKKEQMLKMAVAQAEIAAERTLSPNLNLLYLADLRIKAKDFDRAEQEIAKAEQMDKYHFYCSFLRAKLSFAKGDLNQAKYYLEETEKLKKRAEMVRKLRQAIEKALNTQNPETKPESDIEEPLDSKGSE